MHGATSPLPSQPRERARALVQRLGPHPAALLELDLDAPDDVTLGRWLLAAILLSRPGAEPRALAAFRELAKRGLDTPSAVSATNATTLEEVLAQARVTRPEQTASLLLRASHGIREALPTGLAGLATETDGIEDLGGRLSRLASGFGRAGVTRFLQPLRECWAAADELPLEPAALAAARDLGWISEDCEEAGSAELRGVLALRASGPAQEDGLRLRDVEAALGRLGRAACLRGGIRRCLLGDDCPRPGGA